VWSGWRDLCQVKLNEVSYVEVLGDTSVMYIRVTYIEGT